MIAYEFCRQTKLDLDNILSKEHQTIDVSVIIDILQHTIDFEHDLHKRFTLSQNVEDDIPSRRIKLDQHGGVKVEERTLEEIKDKYKP